ncbi:MAG: cytochrome C [Desulfuromonadaceae bacterium]|nr:cytochrome C [Desulfuromonadaceae bacterium]
MKNKIGIMSILLLMTLLYACANTNSLPRTHPEDISKQGIPDCTSCHTDSWGALNHRAPDFMSKHRFYAASSRQACNSCHYESFCTDCHTNKDEIKPSDKFSDSPERNLPHRGDYMNQHKIDGRVNPVSCVKCHGRQNNARCASCHI